MISPPGYKAAFKTEFSGMSVKFSPFDALKLAYTSSANFGIVGQGKCFILEMLANGQMQVINVFDDKDAMFDCSWSETNEAVLTTASGDGSVKLWDISSKKIIFAEKGHKGDVQCVENSHKLPNLCLSSGFDGFVKLWDFNLGKVMLNLAVSKICVYQATWHPINENLFASVSGDGILNLWDIVGQNKNVAAVKAHQNEILSCDFNKYREEIVTASIDKTIKVWDLRNLKMPTNILTGHRYPVRKVKFSPHEANILGSGSYDMNVIMWDLNNVIQPNVLQHSQHTEFVIGLDFNVFNQKQIASAGWDGRLLVWNWNEEQPKI